MRSGKISRQSLTRWQARRNLALTSASLKGALESGVFCACTHRGPCCVVCQSLGGPDDFVTFVNFASAKHS